MISGHTPKVRLQFDGANAECLNAAEEVSDGSRRVGTDKTALERLHRFLSESGGCQKQFSAASRFFMWRTRVALRMNASEHADLKAARRERERHHARSRMHWMRC